MFRLVKILIIFILHISGITQAASLKDLFSNKIDHFTIEDGLPENSVRCIEKDDYGNYWICTKGGLVRYDGYDFETIIEDRFGNDLSMKIRDIEILKNIIYVATEIGLYKLNIETRIIEKVKIFQAQNLFVYKVHIHDDSIYLGTKYG
ncbi:MAG: two-component regulator propeller domain-containing protein, partial [Gammaproteobacteria bacterium]